MVHLLNSVWFDHLPHKSVKLHKDAIELPQTLVCKGMVSGMMDT